MLINDCSHNDVDAGTQLIIQGLCGPSAVPEIVEVHKQHELKDCGVFAIALDTVMCFQRQGNNINRSLRHFNLYVHEQNWQGFTKG